MSFLIFNMLIAFQFQLPQQWFNVSIGDIGFFLLMFLWEYNQFSTL